MKKLLFVLSIVFFIQPVFSQQYVFPIDDVKQQGFFNEETGKVSFERVIQVPGVSKSELYIRAADWFSRNFNSVSSRIEMQDAELGKLKFTGLIWASYGEGGEYRYGIWQFDVSVTAKEGRYRYEITNITHKKADLSQDILYKYGHGGNFENLKPDCGTSALLSYTISKKLWNSLKYYGYNRIVGFVTDLEQTMTGSFSEDEGW